jgi:hypothetical protein
MTTEFTCGLFTCNSIGTQWALQLNNKAIGYIDNCGEILNYTAPLPLFYEHMLIEIAVLMNNIKRQYKQSQTTS